jgi:hypothetical protein
MESAKNAPKTGHSMIKESALLFLTSVKQVMGSVAQAALTDTF